jgi:hypothetical protein
MLDSIAKGSTGNNTSPLVIDTKYQQCLVGGSQGWFSWFDLDTGQILAVTDWPYGDRPTFTGVYNRPAYDAVRGFVYTACGLASTLLSITVIDCNPSIRDTVGQYVAAGSYPESDTIYCPGNDTVYINNPSGPNLYHTWNPTTHAFTYNQGPAVAGGNLRYLRIAKLVMSLGGDGVIRFFDPALGDALVGSVAFLGGALGWVDDSECTGYIYVAAPQSGSTGLWRIDPANGFSITTLDSSDHWTPMVFDADANLLFTRNFATGNIVTF